MSESSTSHLLVVNTFESLALNDAIEKYGSKLTASDLGHNTFNQLFIDYVMKGVENAGEVPAFIFDHEDKCSNLAVYQF